MVTTNSGLIIPIDLRDRLTFEVGVFCPIPRCEREIWDFYPVDGNPKHVKYENLVPLCQIHFVMAKTQKLTRKMLSAIRNLLSRSLQNRPEYKELPSRSALLHEITGQLYNTGDELHLTYVGPLCFHPNWYHDRRDSKEIGVPNLERPFRQYLTTHNERTHSIRIEFRNAPRYLEKINEIVMPNERTKFIQETLADIDEVFGEYGENGPDIACLETGFFRHPYVFRGAVIEASRGAPHLPMAQGILITDPHYVQWEKFSYNQVFDLGYRGQEEELQTLKDFVSHLWD